MIQAYQNNQTQTATKLTQNSLTISRSPSAEAPPPNPPPDYSGTQSTVDAKGNVTTTVSRDDGSYTVTVTDPSGKVLSVRQYDSNGNLLTTPSTFWNSLFATPTSIALVAVVAVAVYFIFFRK